MRPLDTTPEAYAVQTEVLRRLTGEQRFRIAIEMSELARDLQRAGILAEHPDWSAEQVTNEMIRRQLPPGAWPPPPRE